MKPYIALTLLALVVTVSGCTQSPELRTSDDKISIEGDNSKELEVWVKNNYDEAAGFSLNVESPRLLNVKDAITDETIRELDLGEAKGGSITNKETIQISGNASRLGEQQTQGTFNIKLVVDGESGSAEEDRITKEIEVVVSK